MEEAMEQRLNRFKNWLEKERDEAVNAQKVVNNPISLARKQSNEHILNLAIIYFDKIVMEGR